MNHTIAAVVDEDVIIGAIASILVGPSALAALDGNGVIVDAHIASMNEDVVTNIDVDGIAARCLQDYSGREDGAVEITHMVGTIKVVGPERTVDQLDILHCNVLAVGDINQPRALFVLVGTGRIPLAA